MHHRDGKPKTRWEYMQDAFSGFVDSKLKHENKGKYLNIINLFVKLDVISVIFHNRESRVIIREGDL